MQVVRRDNSQLQRDILKSLIQTMVHPISEVELAEHRAESKGALMKQRIAELVKDFNAKLVAQCDPKTPDPLPIDKFVISQSISKRGYENLNAAGQKSAVCLRCADTQRVRVRWACGRGCVRGSRAGARFHLHACLEGQGLYV
jgi:DNA polymerase elongation subunit (family B)